MRISDWSSDVCSSDLIPGFQEVSPDQYRIATEKNRRTLFLYGFGNRIAGNCRQVPITAEIIRRMPKIHTAWISILSPRNHIPPHPGVPTRILRAHLGLNPTRTRETRHIQTEIEKTP